MQSATSVSIRPARPEDWPAIARLLSAAALPLEGGLAHLDNFVVALDARGVVGVAGLESHGRVALLRSVAVSAGARGRGIGRALTAAVVEGARKSGLHQLVLLTTSARGYFERLGFREVDRSAVAPELLASRAFQGGCPASATVMRRALLPVAVLGAGPVGLAAAAHLLERGIEPLILEAGATVGASLHSYAHVRLFSPWRYNIDPAARRLLEANGWISPAPDGLPTAAELLGDYLAPLARTPGIAAALRLRHRVTGLTRLGFDKVSTRGREHAPFVITTDGDGGAGAFLAQAVIDATGTWASPNPLGADGLPARGEPACADRIAYGMPDVLGAARERYAGKSVLVVGAGHSAAGTLVALARLAQDAPTTRVTWAVRGERLARVFGEGAADGLPARGALGERLRSLVDGGRLDLRYCFRTGAVERCNGQLRIHGQRPGQTIEGIDQIIVAAGARPDLGITRELRVRHDPWLESTDALAPLIDPNEHSCGTVRPHGHRELAHPEPGYYAVGAKSYGRAPNFLLATGYEQVRSVVAALAGEVKAADAVELELPATGACNAPVAARDATHGAAALGCCGAAAPAPTDACCVLDAATTTPAKAGCGCR